VLDDARVVEHLLLEAVVEAGPHLGRQQGRRGGEGRSGRAQRDAGDRAEPPVQLVEGGVGEGVARPDAGQGGAHEQGVRLPPRGRGEQRPAGRGHRRLRLGAGQR